MRIVVSILLLMHAISLSAQKLEQGFDYSFKPTTSSPFYYVVTEKKDTGWHRQAWYFSQKSLAMEGWYKDEACKIPHGIVTWYHTTRFPRSTGRYYDGKKEGVWLEYDSVGILKDSANYMEGKLKGVRLQWYANGMLADSSEFDGAGNGVEITWYDDGALSSAGYWTGDTLKKGRWKYYYRNGTLKATEDYKEEKMIACNCYDEAGVALDTAMCREQEARLLDKDAYKRFLERNIRLDDLVRNGLPKGIYTVVVRFLVDKDGVIADVTPLTSFGYGLEKMVADVIKRSPRWVPGRQHGQNVKSYYTQPVTLSVQ
jgi:antitoxin component YwqK of YwqJK toxin-antitoxin module